MRLPRALPVIAALLAPAWSLSADEMHPVIPEISLTLEDGSLRIAGHVSSNGARTVTATLSVAHQGGGGSIDTSQSSMIELVPGERARVAVIGINFGPGSQLAATLTIDDGDSTIARSRAEIGLPD